ncbi:hypothetical protein [Cellvibrio sp. QJXJ]|uniref:hypothetical protein n=1 Tax=Cellvibrio sp. QJXJ TaxID=2964606 RepID=UPI0021C2D346|nr:hypothetical protein [Cellvibrio sp. QJXJ]UUA73079.1 hypothetical protein NNX04_01200 [Cellvibrio sp. QJXJ]
MQIKRTYTDKEFAQMRRENAEMTKGVSFSQEGIAKLPKVTPKAREEVRKMAASAMAELRAHGWLSTKKI